MDADRVEHTDPAAEPVAAARGDPPDLAGPQPGPVVFKLLAGGNGDADEVVLPVAIRSIDRC